jgi:tryptophanyl-tRNA synthetase
MEKEVEKINEILSILDKDTQMKVIAECASRIGTTEWKEAVKDLIKRMANL